jgi:two-component system CheB/CheR fusion protein
VLKHRLDRLVPAVRRALAEARERAERKRLEEELRQRADELARADRRKDEFLAMLAHELRNPLAPIRNALQIMRLRGLPDPTVRQAWEIMSRQAEHLSSLVDDLLDVSRITRGKVQLKVQRTDLAAAVAMAVDATRPLVEKRNHTLNVALPPTPVWVEADPVRLTQVVTNLLTNAAKYTDPGGRIDVAGRANGTQAVLTVRDTGIGIAPEAQATVFDLFVQTDDSLDRSQGGLGIGLTLARRLVEMHGGSVAVASEGKGKGSEFTVRLPLSPAGGPVVPAAAEPAPPVGSASRRIAVVDDNKDGAESLALLLRMWGHEPFLAFDGAAALKLIETERPDLVLLDIGLPRLDGYEVARRIRAAGPHPVLVAMTGYGQEEDRRKSRAAGFDHHLTKPVEPDALQAVIAAGHRS